MILTKFVIVKAFDKITCIDWAEVTPILLPDVIRHDLTLRKEIYVFRFLLSSLTGTRIPC